MPHKRETPQANHTAFPAMAHHVAASGLGRPAAIPLRDLAKDRSTEQQAPTEIPDKHKGPASPDIRPFQLRTNNAELPDNLRSDKPFQLQALANAQGPDIYAAPGRQLPQDAWHVVQQKQGEVRPALQKKAGANMIAHTAAVIQRVVKFDGDNRINELTVRIPKKRIKYKKATPRNRHRPKITRMIQTPLLQELGSTRDMLLGKTFKEAIAVMVERAERHITHEDFTGLQKGVQDKILKAAKTLFKLMKQESGDQSPEEHLDALIDKYVDLLEKIYYPEMTITDEDIEDEPGSAISTQEVLESFLLNKDELDKRMTGWVERLGEDRTKKASDAPSKRQKRFDETNEHSLLMFTHTAPAKHSSVNTHKQGKDLYPTAKAHFEYYRSGENRQSQFFKDQSKKQFIFIKEMYDFYKELDSGANFKDFEVIAPGVMHALFDKGRYNHSGYGAEVNAYAKEKLLIESGKSYKGETMTPQDTHGHHFIHTSNEHVTSMYLDLIAKSEGKFDASYTSIILDHCRKVANELVKLNSQLKNFTIVLADQRSGFITYPCPIIEPIVNKTSKRALTTVQIQEYIDFIMAKFNEGSKVKMFQRNSFGFLYPSIADLQRSIRLWPGQLDPDYFVGKISAILKLYDYEISNPQKKSPVLKKTPAAIDGTSNHSTLFSTLSRAMEYIRKIYRMGGFRPGLALQFLHQRIVSNLTKANELLGMQEGNDYYGMDKEDLFLEITQVIENLNEFGFQLVELQQWKPSSEDFSKIIAQSYGTVVQAGGYNITGAALTHSGMQAGMIAMKLRKTSVFDLGPSYFEFPGDVLNKKNIKKQKKHGKTGHYDPAYNYTHAKELTKITEAPFKDSDHQCIIIDITNVKPSELPEILARHKKNTPSIFLYGSLSKHFQLGMDRFTLGLVIELNQEQKPSGLGSYAVPEELIRYFILMQDTHNMGLDKELAGK